MLEHITANHEPQSPKSPARYIMIRERIERTFDQQQWLEINKFDPVTFARLQCKIYDCLINSEQLFAKYFDIFYENHVRLYHWCLLARDRKHELEGYVFRNLLRKKLEWHRSQLKNLHDRGKEREKPEAAHKSKNKEEIRKMVDAKRYHIDDLSQEIFNFMATKTTTASLQVPRKPWSFHKSSHHKATPTLLKMNSISSYKQNFPGQSESVIMGAENKAAKPSRRLNNLQRSLHSPHDFHELFLQTIEACDGGKYIFYDYEKHMKGLSEKQKYNEFIRSRSRSPSQTGQRLTQTSEEKKQPSGFKEASHHSEVDLRKTAFEFSTYGCAVDRRQTRHETKVVFRRLRSKNNGKFIRK